MHKALLNLEFTSQGLTFCVWTNQCQLFEIITTQMDAISLFYSGISELNGALAQLCA